MIMLTQYSAKKSSRHALRDIVRVQNHNTIKQNHRLFLGNIRISPSTSDTGILLATGVQRAASPWRTLGIRSCQTFCSDLA